MVTTVFSILVVVAGFIGYKSYSDINAELTNNIEDQIEPLNNKIYLIDSLLTNFNTFIDHFKLNQDSLQIKLNTSSKGIDTLGTKTNIILNDIIDIQNQLINYPTLYIIHDLSFITKDLKNTPIQRYYFNDIETIDNKKLQLFNKPPIAFLTAYGNSIYINYIT